MQEITFSNPRGYHVQSEHGLQGFFQRINKDMLNVQTSGLIALVKELLQRALIKTGFSEMLAVGEACRTD